MDFIYITLVACSCSPVQTFNNSMAYTTRQLQCIDTRDMVQTVHRWCVQRDTFVHRYCIRPISADRPDLLTATQIVSSRLAFVAQRPSLHSIYPIRHLAAPGSHWDWNSCDWNRFVGFYSVREWLNRVPIVLDSIGTNASIRLNWLTRVLEQNCRCRRMWAKWYWWVAS